MKRLFIFCIALLMCTYAAAENYTVSLPAGKAIHSGPGRNFEIARNLDESGVFTIVEETWDENGSLWGMLKSGAGWVQLDESLSYTRALSTGTDVRTGPGYEYDIAQTIDKDGVFTIVAETWDEAGNPWGKLKSGAGWIALNCHPYTTPLYSGTDIHSGPGYVYAVERTLDEKGMFTIVEEAWDLYGNLWGKLKSGAGWVFLKSESTMIFSPIRAKYAGNALLESNTGYRLIADNSEYAVHIVFFANEPLRDITFSSMILGECDFEIDEPLFFLHELDINVPFITSVDFPGDMTTYAISFTDDAGTARCYTVSISGMDGSLELIEQK